jgi:hypothetical protein
MAPEILSNKLLAPLAANRILLCPLELNFYEQTVSAGSSVVARGLPIFRPRLA